MESDNWFHVIKEFFLLLLIFVYFSSFPILIDLFGENIYTLVFAVILAIGSLVLVVRKIARFTVNLRPKKIFKTVVMIIFAFIFLNALLGAYIYGSLLVENESVVSAMQLLTSLSILIYSGTVAYKV